MNFVQNVTQDLRANISGEHVGKAQTDFGDAGRNLGKAAATIHNDYLAQEFEAYKASASQNLNLQLQMPNLSAIPTAEDTLSSELDLQKKLKDLAQARASGEISDQELNIKYDKALRTSGLNLKQINSVRSGLSEDEKKVLDNTAATTNFLAQREGQKKAVQDTEEADTKRRLELAETLGLTSPDASVEEKIEASRRYEQAENTMIIANQAAEKDPNNPGALEFQKISVGKFVNDMASRSAYDLISKHGPADGYAILEKAAYDSIASAGVNITPRVQEIVSKVLKGYKDMTVEQLESLKRINEQMSADDTYQLNKVIQGLPTGTKNALRVAQYYGIQNVFTAEDFMSMVKGTADAANTKSQGLLDRVSIEARKVMAMNSFKNSSKGVPPAPGNQNTETANVNEMGKQYLSQTDPASVRQNIENRGAFTNYYDQVNPNDLTPHQRQAAILNMLGFNKILLESVSKDLDNSYSVGVTPTGGYVALHNGVPVEASAFDKTVGSNDVVILETVSKMNENQNTLNKYGATPEDMYKAIKDVKFTGSDWGNTIGSAIDSGTEALGSAIPIVNKVLDLGGLERLKFSRGVRNFIQEFGQGAKEGFRNISGYGGPQEHRMLKEGIFSESDRPAEGLTDTGETSPEVMTAALEVKPTEGEATQGLTVNYKALDGEYTGTVTTGGDIPPGTTVWTHRRARKKALSQESIDKAKADFSPVVDEVVDQMDAGETTVTIPTLSDGKKVNVTTAPDLALIVLGEGFTESKSKSNTIGFGTKVEAAKPILKEMGITYSDDTKITHEQGLELAHRYLKKDIDSKIKSVIGEEAFNMLDPIRLMVARDVLYAYGRSSVNWTGYKQVGLDKYLLNTLDESKPVSEILKYKPTFPPFVGKRNGARQVFYAPYGASRMGLVEAFLDNLE